MDVDLLTPWLSTEERPRPRLNVQSVVVCDIVVPARRNLLQIDEHMERQKGLQGAAL